jgi:ATP-dependent Lon protease
MSDEPIITQDTALSALATPTPIQLAVEEKLRRLFPDLIVPKRLAAFQEIVKVPRFISEYLIQRAAKTTTEDKAIIGQVNDFLARYRPEHKDREWLKSKILEEGSVRLLDFFDAYTDLEGGRFLVDIPLLAVREAIVPKEIKDENENLLRGGMWGLATIGFTDTEDGPAPALLKFVPFQVQRCDVRYYQDARKEFTLEEWAFAMVSTIGLNPDKYPSFREKMILVTRLIPFVEDNTFLSEFGQPGTGKTFLYDKLSAYGRVISGSVETPANLFYHGTKRKPGILAVADVVLFDEIDKVGGRKIDTEVVGKLLKFMESGSFDRLGTPITSSASVVFGGNLREFQTPLYRLFPDDMQHKAFFDRIHGFIFGELLPPIGKSAEFVSPSLGFTSDYFSEILHRLRHYSWTDVVRSRIKLTKGGVRDEKAISKIVSGLIKVLYPHGEITTEELKMLVDHAIQMRNRSNEQIRRIDPNADASFVQAEVVG